MNTSNTSKKFCFISNSEKSYIAEYLNLSKQDKNKDYSFKNLDLNGLIEYSPNIIVVDLYFADKNYNKIAELIKNTFPKTLIYILSPEYADYNGLIQSLNNPLHYYSNFSMDILSHINKAIGGGYSYSEAS